jgi:hypothetical protein
LVQTADTGQINWVTVARAAINTDAGSAIYYLNDSLHGTAPVYMKFYFGSAGVIDRPRIRLEIGTSTNGSGTIGGTAKTAIATLSDGNSNPLSAYPSYVCAAAGFFGMFWKLGNGNGFSFFVARTVDSAGAPTDTGATAFSAVSNQVRLDQSLRFASPAAAYQTSAGIVAAVPNLPGTNPASTDDGAGNNQVYLCWGAWPKVGPFATVCVVRGAEYAAGTTFSVALVGATARTFISPGTSYYGPPNRSSASWPIALLWE